MYTIEKNKFLSFLDEEILGNLEDVGAILAGGAITSVFTNREINDLDIYLPDELSLIKLVGAWFGNTDLCGELTPNSKGKKRTLSIEDTSFSCIYVSSSSRSITFIHNDVQIQLMHFKYFNSPQEIFDTFDYTCCMGAYSFKEGEFTFHDDFFKHNSQRFLKFNTGTSYPLMSLLRIQKYKERGYNISKSEMLRVVLQCSQVDINSWEEAAEHIGGMYGVLDDSLFDKSKEFSMEELIEQLGSLEGKPIREFRNMEGYNVEDILFKVLGDKLPKPEGWVDFEEEGCYYKTVGRDGLSPIADTWKKISYVKGQIVNGGENGIYCKDSINNVRYSYPLMVKLKPLSKNFDAPFLEQIFGDVEVVDIVPRDKVIFSKYAAILAYIESKAKVKRSLYY